jgi:hypothetical protein
VCDVEAGCQYPDSEAGVACGDSADSECDAADTCDGAGSCQDNIADAGTPCGDGGSGLCDAPDSCDGAGTCDARHIAAGTECRAPGGECDVAESCDGAGSCPEDAFAEPDTHCGAPGDGACDLQDTCNDSGQCHDNVDTEDGDEDSTPDCADGCPSDPDKVEPGVCGCGVPEAACSSEDRDGDGVSDALDRCPGTALPDMQDPDNPASFRQLGPMHAADIDGDRVLEVNVGSQKSPVIIDSWFTLDDTFGCSCEQILRCLPGEATGQYRFGCSTGTLAVFTSNTGWAADCARAANR